MKTLKCIIPVICLFFALNIQAQSILRGNHMDCGETSDYYIYHDATQNVTADASCWTITGGTIVEHYDDYTRIKVVWRPNAVSKKVTLNRYYLNGISQPGGVITVGACGTLAGVVCTDISSSALPNTNGVISGLTFTVDGTFKISPTHAQFVNCNIYVKDNSQIVMPVATSFVDFTGCKFYMGANSAIIVESNSGVYFNACNLENGTPEKWTGIIVQTEMIMKFAIRDGYMAGARTALKIDGGVSAMIERNVFGRNNGVVSSTGIANGGIEFLSNWVVPTSQLMALSSAPNFRAYIKTNIIDKQGFNIVNLPYVEVRNNKILDSYLSIGQLDPNSTLGDVYISDNKIINPDFCALMIENYNSYIYNNDINTNTPNLSDVCAIEILTSKNNTIKIYDNRITPSVGKAGIRIIAAVWLPCESENVAIYNNTITLSQPPAGSQHSLNSFGILVGDLSSTSAVDIHHNKITTIGPIKEVCTGIQILGNRGHNSISENLIEMNGASSGFDIKSIFILNSLADVRKNTVKFGDAGIYIQGDCYRSTIKCNTLWDNRYGIRLENARLQNQGSDVVDGASGNTWLGVFRNGSLNTKISGTVVETVTWYWCENSSGSFCGFPAGLSIPTPWSYCPQNNCSIGGEYCIGGPGIQFSKGTASTASNCGGCPYYPVVANRDDFSENMNVNTVETRYVDTGILETSSVSSLQEPVSLNVFPNPANDQLTIENSSGQARIDLFDMNARNVLSTEMQNGSSALSISHLSPGIYTYQIYDHQGNVLKTGKVSIVR